MKSKIKTKNKTKTANKTYRTIRKLKKKSIITPIFMFVCSLVISGIIVLIAMVSFTDFIFNSKYSNTIYEASHIFAKIESAREHGVSYDELLADLNDDINAATAVCVYSEDGRILSCYGQRPELKKDRIFDLSDNQTVHVSLSNRDGVDASDGTGRVYIYYADIFKDSVVDLDTAFDDKGADDFSIKSGLQYEAYEYPFWLTETLEDDNCKIFILQKIVMSVNDFLSLIIPISIFGLLFLFMNIIHLINAISNIHMKKSFIKLFLSDQVTDGNNELYYTYTTHKAISSWFNRKKGFAVVDFSLVKYQNYCTLYGVEAGEKLIKGIDVCIRKKLGRGEIVARVNGGDFHLLLKVKDEASGQKILVERVDNLMKMLPEMLAEYFKCRSDHPSLNNMKFKAGLYYLPPVTDEDTKHRRNKNVLDITNLCIKANMAKQASGDESGLFVYNHEQWEKEVWEQKVENMMEDALANEEFSVYIQPKYHPSTEELKGGEALVRWISPTEGFISPGQFIPIFERTGFVTKLDDYMVSRTAKLQADWLKEGKQIVPISVNVSRAHFAQPDLAEHIRELVDVYELPHKYIEIELTESAFFDDKKALLATVGKLQEYGFEVSMDDFGSGYSSLNSLKDLPLNVLKLDGEFFRGEEFGGRGEIVVAEAISLAKQLDMRIVAEGVEKKEQVDFLASQNCDMIQGYYFAKPMPAEEYALRMK